MALAEPVGAVHNALQSGPSIQSLALFAVFVLTVLRFMIGDILHLENDELTDDDGEAKWFWDGSFIVLECIVLILMGSVASVSQNAISRVGFFDLLVLLYALDVVWILSISLLHLLAGVGPLRRVMGPMRRESDAFPIGWAVLNGTLMIFLWLFGFLTDVKFSNCELWLLVAVNLIAFSVDVFVLNYGMPAER